MISNKKALLRDCSGLRAFVQTTLRMNNRTAVTNRPMINRRNFERVALPGSEVCSAGVIEKSLPQAATAWTTDLSSKKKGGHEDHPEVPYEQNYS